MKEQTNPYRDTQAAAMLSAALQRYTAQNPGGLRALATRLGIGQATVLSHMAHGRIGIPLDRVAQLAEILDIDSADFSLAVLKQRAPEVYTELNNRFEFSTAGLIRSSDRGVTGDRQLTSVSTPTPRPHIIAVGDEADVIRHLRNHRPMGLEPAEKRILIEFIEGLLSEDRTDGK